MKFFVVALAVVSLAVASQAAAPSARKDFSVLVDTALLQARNQFVANSAIAGDQLQSFIKVAEMKVENMKMGNRNIVQACSDINREIVEIDKQISATMAGIVSRIVPAYNRATENVISYISAAPKK
ncbi:uncharacterized protein LOC141857304 [Brevipalpus obovatus]|uniref:uncharacterized protein LOC141857304 n=1 Tax=Brevipalpus obovatus TaxID=246614 RepID=UPI003D9EE277